jgi:hypothetical protein
MKNDMVGRRFAASTSMRGDGSARRMLSQVSGNLCLALAGLIALLVLSACDRPLSSEQSPVQRTVQRAGAMSTSAEWRVVGGSEGASATLLLQDGKPVLVIACKVDSGRLEVEVPGFTRIGSEDRLSFGFDDDPIALAVDMRRQGAGIRADGAAPANIAERILTAKQISLAYGQQRLGPYSPPGEADRQSLAVACSPQVLSR